MAGLLHCAFCSQLGLDGVDNPRMRFGSDDGEKASPMIERLAR
jgi:hypothetical protein